MAPQPLAIRKLADRTSAERAVRFDPETGEKFLYDPTTPGFDPEPWPLLGVRVEGGAPKHTVVSTTWVARARAEGWATLEGEEVVHRPGGPRENPWAVTHTFVHGKALVLHTVDGDVRYRIVTNPDKWPADKDGDLGFGGEVRWTYELKLEKAG